MGIQAVVAICVREGERGKVYVPAQTMAEAAESEADRRLQALLENTGLTLPDEPLQSIRPSPNARGVSAVTRFGLRVWSQLFTRRQLLVLLTFVKHIRAAHDELLEAGADPDFARAVATYLAFIVDKLAERGANVCRWDNSRETIVSPIANGKVQMVWDFPEANPFGGTSGSWEQAAGDLAHSLGAIAESRTLLSAQRNVARP